MHAIGAAHRCSGCVTTREMHEGRHREIAELMVDYRAAEEAPCGLDDVGVSTSTPTRNGRGVLTEIAGNVGMDMRGRGGDEDARRRNGIGRHQRGGEQRIIVHEDIENHNEDGDRKEKKTDDLNNANTIVEEIHDENGEDFDDDGDTASLSSYATSSIDHTNPSSSTKKSTKAQLRAEKKAKKSAKATSKAMKNQNRNLATITSADIERVARILHGDETDATRDGNAHPLATDKTVEDVISRNLGFVKNIQVHKAYLFASVAKGRKEIKERKRLKKKESMGLSSGEETVEMEGVVGAIMIKLGVSPGVVAASAAAATNMSMSTPLRCAANGFASGRKRASSGLPPSTPSSAGSAGKTQCAANGASRASVAVAAKLRNAIKIDLEKHENEVHARYVRAGGFWRYVGKSTFERMTEFARDTDIATGECWEKKLAREGKSAVVNGNDEEKEQPEKDAQEEY